MQQTLDHSYLKNCVALKRAVLMLYKGSGYLLAACVLGDGLGALTDSVLSKFTG